MLRRLLVLPLFLAAVGLAVAQEKKDDTGIAGEYRVVSITKAGIALDKAALEEMKGVSIRDGKLVAKLPGEERVAAIKLDPAANPKTIDMTPSLPDTAEGKKAPEIVLPGIYALDGGQLTISLAASASAARPTTMTSTADNKQFVLVLSKNAVAVEAKGGAKTKSVVPSTRAVEKGEVPKEAPKK